MDRRQQKTRKAIFTAFCRLLEERKYNKITVQDIIDAADVGRSTFYAHFETKDSLLDAMCNEIFHHIFENDPCPYNGKDNDLLGVLTHTLWHIQNDKKDLMGVLLSDSGDLFLNYFKMHLEKIFNGFCENLNPQVPKEFFLHHLCSGFAETVKWWLKEGTKTPPERVAEYFVKIYSL